VALVIDGDSQGELMVVLGDGCGQLQGRDRKEVYAVQE
jgi:hypothetical protein